ncbi:hypothetical protein DEO72_LG8g1672 [Vigna unguiculata]|uniref:Cupredoxin n=1 Tax=Vigna unguiculata TaxID=3917 RepID=A0A4D6MUS2_VIGUN|nr:hypothetical protein DEO72_LG8g1672 [Vigna unguiculata]
MVKIFIATLLLALVSQGYSQCSLSDIHVTQSATGHKVNGKPEWTVNLSLTGLSYSIMLGTLNSH